MKIVGTLLLLTILILFLSSCTTVRRIRKDSIFLTPKDWTLLNSNKVEVGMQKQTILEKFISPDKQYYENGIEVLVYKKNSAFLYFKDNILTKIVIEEKDTITDKLNRIANPAP